MVRNIRDTAVPLIYRARETYGKERGRGRVNAGLDLDCPIPWNTRSGRRLLRESQVAAMILMGASRVQKGQRVRRQKPPSSTLS
jgi:hypothetical protein